MTDQNQSPPIVVNEKAGPDQWAAAIRQILLVIAGIATVFGWKHLAGEASGLIAISAPLGGLVVFALGQWKTRQSSLNLTKLARKVPDSVARVK